MLQLNLLSILVRYGIGDFLNLFGPNIQTQVTTELYLRTRRGNARHKKESKSQMERSKRRSNNTKDGAPWMEDQVQTRDEI